MNRIGQGVMGARQVRGRILGMACVLSLLVGCGGNLQTTKPRVDDNALYKGRSTVTFSSLPTAESPEQAIQEGDRQRLAGEQDKALYMYLQAMELDRENTEALYKIGDVHLVRGDYSKARLAFNDLLEIDPLHVGGNEARGVLHLKRNRYPAALNHFMKAVDEDTKRLTQLSEKGQVDARSPALAYDGLGIISDLKGDHVLAQHYYGMALKIRPESAITYNNLGYSYYLTQSWSAAEQAYKKALRLHTEYAQAWRNLGLLYARQKNYMSAVTAFERVMEPAEAHNDVGYICLLEGKYGKAEYFFEKALTLSPSYYEKANDNLRLTRRLRDGLASSE